MRWHSMIINGGVRIVDEIGVWSGVLIEAEYYEVYANQPAFVVYRLETIPPH